MKPTVSQIQSRLAMILLLVYVFTISTYIIFLPNHTADHFSPLKIAMVNISKISNADASGNFYAKQHGAFKTTAQNTRKTIGSLFNITIPVSLFAASSFFKSLFAGKPKIAPNNQVYQPNDSCIVLCRFRI